MGVAENQRAELHDGDEAGQIHDFGIGVPAIKHAGKVEEFGALVYFGPEAFFEGFFSVLEG